MSRSTNTDLINPATRFFDWSGATGAVSHYDKTANENITVKLPFKFLILDRVAQVTGGIERYGKYEGFWSNAVRNTKTQPFTVRSKQGVECQGLYENIKGTPGVKYMQGLYIAFYNDDKTLEIGYLKIKGAALTAWIEFTKNHRNIYDGAFAITGKTEEKKGATTYFSPVFAHSTNIGEDTENVAKMLDTHLQEYLTAYFANNGQIEEVAHVEEVIDEGFSGPPNFPNGTPDDPDDSEIPW